MLLLKRNFRTSQFTSAVKQCRIEDNKKKKKKVKLKPDTPKAKVLIVGAGMAGLSAAASLYKAGFKDVIILEANDRPGGRIHSCWLGTSIAEIGAQWIAGSSISNSIFTLACQEGLLDPKCLIRYDFSKGVYIMSNGEIISKHVAYQAYLTFKEIEKQAASLYHMGPTGVKHGNLMNFFAMRIEQELNNFPPAHRAPGSRVMYGLTNKISNRWGADLTKMNADLYGCYNHSVGETIGIPLGFIGVISPLIRKIPQFQIKYNKIVENIQYADVRNDKARVVVKCCDRAVYCADYCICTVSLGVLKSHVHNMFSPRLPPEKVEAINKLGYGTICKIFFEYKRPFWMSRQGPIKFAWSLEELNESSDWMRSMCCLEEVMATNNILMAIVSGKHAKCVELLTDQKVAEDITHLLRCITKDPTIPFPRSVLRSKWYSSPFFKGANSFMKTESTVGHQIDLGKPVCSSSEKGCNSKLVPVVFFAGEATCPFIFSTVNGARQSGLKAAEKIIELTEKFKGPPPKEHEEKPCPEEEEDEKKKKAEVC